MPQVIATVTTLDERPVEISARRGEVQMLFLAEVAPGWPVQGATGLVDRLRFGPETCLLVEQALKTARLLVLSEEEPDAGT